MHPKLGEKHIQIAILDRGWKGGACFHVSRVPRGTGPTNNKNKKGSVPGLLAKGSVQGSVQGLLAKPLGENTLKSRFWIDIEKGGRYREAI